MQLKLFGDPKSLFVFLRENETTKLIFVGQKKNINSVTASAIFTTVYGYLLEVVTSKF